MCNDYRLKVEAASILEDFADLKIKIRFSEGTPNVQARDDIKITDTAPIVRSVDGERNAGDLVQRRWSWPGQNGRPVYNFRSEGRESPSPPALPQPAPERHTNRGGRALILCAAEHGFVGGFNERLVDAAEATLEPRDALFVLGTRGAALALERGRQMAWTRPMATRWRERPRPSVAFLPSSMHALRGAKSRESR